MDLNLMLLPNFLPNYYQKTFDNKIILPQNYNYNFPYIKSYYEYIDVNQDKELIKKVVMYFYNELMFNWIKKDSEFKIFENKKMLKTKDGLQLIYKILDKLVKKGNTKWWDLRDPQYFLTKDYLKYQLTKYFNKNQ